MDVSISSLVPYQSSGSGIVRRDASEEGRLGQFPDGGHGGPAGCEITEGDPMAETAETGGLKCDVPRIQQICELLFYNGKVIAVDPPQFVDLMVSLNPRSVDQASCKALDSHCERRPVPLNSSRLHCHDCTPADCRYTPGRQGQHRLWGRHEERCARDWGNGAGAVIRRERDQDQGGHTNRTVPQQVELTDPYRLNQ